MQLSLKQAEVTLVNQVYMLFSLSFCKWFKDSPVKCVTPFELD